MTFVNSCFEYTSKLSPSLRAKEPSGPCACKPRALEASAVEISDITGGVCIHPLEKIQRVRKGQAYILPHTWIFATGKSRNNLYAIEELEQAYTTNRCLSPITTYVTPSVD